MEQDKRRDQDWTPTWLERVRRRVRRWCAAGAGTTWIVAVSGGGDSVGLVRALHRLAPELGLTLSVAHLDHGTRGEAARADAAFVHALAGSLGLPLDLGQWRPTRARHFEADARRARYSWLLEIAATRGASAIAVGHTRDDQAETILHRIIRGTGLRGLAGMPPRRVLSWDPPVILIRPLLSVSRQAIRTSLGSLGQGFREDASNADQARTRARIRHDLLPRLAQEYNPRVAEAIVRLGMLAGASERAMERDVIELEHDATRLLSHDQVELRRDRLLQSPLFLRAEVLRRVWRLAGWPEAGMSAQRWRRLASLARSQRISRMAIGCGIELTTTGAGGCPPNGFVLRRVGGSGSSSCRPAPIEQIPMEVPGCVPWGTGTITTLLEPSAPRDETIDLDRIVPSLCVRAPVPGDRFEPLGMKGRSTPLNDFFRGRNIVPEERARTPLLCDAAGIVWVVGHRIADRVKVTEQTRRTLGLRWQVDPRG
ncbi:MAG: tRNA lysidine(34) synthetase TilS [Isosphaeraceae bacterium]